MTKGHPNLQGGMYVLSDSILAMLAFIVAYLFRFELGILPVTRGYPPFEQYLAVLPIVGLLVPVAFHFNGLYRANRSRTNVDDFFGVFIGSILAVVLGILSTLYVQTYYLPEELKQRGAFEISQLAWVVFLIFNTIFSFSSRKFVRELIERRWRAGIGLKRVLVAGAGELGRRVADKALRQRELGHQIIGFVDDKAATSHLGYRGLPLLGTLKETEDILQRENIDILYLTLPTEDQMKMLALIEVANKECIEIKVVPNLLQFMVLKAGLEDMDGIPIIRVNEVPLHGFNNTLKRFVDISLSTVALGILAAPMALIALIVKNSSPGPALYKQERMGLDGQSFTVYKFRSMTENAESETGPMWSRENDPRRTQLGILLRRFHFDELPQLWNVLRGDMSLVGPRPERPYFVEQFKQRIPHYMLRHKVKSGITGWAQVNGWRGNTSVEKRIEFDLYYIENWSIGLDFKILWLTIARGIFHIRAF